MNEDDQPQWAGAPLIHFSDDDRAMLKEAAGLLEVPFLPGEYPEEQERETERTKYLAGKLAGLAGRPDVNSNGGY